MKTYSTKPLVGHINQCQICNNKGLEIVLPLGHQPPVHAHLTKEGLGQPEITYPLNFCRCDKCGLLQLDYIVDPKIVFYPEYPYYTGMTSMLVRNFQLLTNLLINQYKLTKKDLAIDIGSNDGTLLKGFKNQGMRVLGIEPTNVAKIATKNGIPTIQEFFNEETAKKIIKKNGRAKIITATNIFAHINNLFEFMESIKKILDDGGIFVSESQYLMDIIEKLEFDTIYHEHLRFYSLRPLRRLFSQTGFSLVDAERIQAAGGSIRVYAMKGKHSPSKRVYKLINDEEKAGLYKIQTFRKFARQALIAKRKLLAILINCKKGDNRIVGLGAPARSNTLLGFTKIGTDFLDYVAERKGSPKIGLFTPGTHLPVIDEQKIFEQKIPYVLILSWHIGKELMKKFRERGYTGKFIMPLPKPTVIPK